MAKNTVLNLLHEAGIPPTVEEIQALNSLGSMIELDGEAIADLEEILDECMEIAELESMVQPSGTTWELAMVVTEKDKEAARKRNARYAKRKR